MPNRVSSGDSPKVKASGPAKGAAAKAAPARSASKVAAPPAAKPAGKPVAEPSAEPAAKPVVRAKATAKASPAKVAAPKAAAKPVAIVKTSPKPVATAKTPLKPGGAKAPPARQGKPNYDKDALGSIRKRLQEQRDQLQSQLTAIEESAAGLSQSEMSGEVSYDEDFADAGSFTFDREKEFSIANNVTDLRSKTERALHKIEEGSYGICESCGQPIEAARLKALPHVTLCLKCKKAEERR